MSKFIEDPSYVPYLELSQRFGLNQIIALKKLRYYVKNT